MCAEVIQHSHLFRTALPHGACAKFHELPILLIFGPGLQIIIYLIILASKARHTNLIDTTGGRGLRLCPL